MTVLPPRSQPVPPIVALLALAAAALTSCSGNGCDRLAELTAQRDAARAAYSELVRSGTATTTQTEQGDADTHALDRQVYDLAKRCQ